ncbi:CoA-binding protein [Myroides marinus]|uniref:CoA-binding protein n=1 Tax=Myroides marinus TaxID=703342 RepID=UPI0025773799|nr:CoA-binding protein [Myroides marinus]MDM1372647.1 CoA-binding protein [Myroides marinus]MDM1531316.1 CoA-binding protein [Myroides marinus]MDM1538536.1 CoA-binding protein [Myroides marinus]
MKTLVVGASLKEERYSNKAINMLREYGHEVVAHGLKEGKVLDVDICKDWKNYEDVDTVTLYLNPTRQEELYDDIIKLHPRRVIFNPGTENSVFVSLLSENNIQSEEACTLVLLRTEQY